MIGNWYEETMLTKRYKNIETTLTAESELLGKYQIEMNKVKDANKQSSDDIKRKTKELRECSPMQIKKKSELQKQIHEAQEGIEHRNEYLQGIARMCGFKSEDDYAVRANNQVNRKEDHKKLGSLIEAISEDSNKLTKEYHETIETIDDNTRDAVEEKRMTERSKTEKMVRDKLISKYGDKYDLETFEKSKEQVDETLKPESNVHANVEEKVIKNIHSR